MASSYAISSWLFTRALSAIYLIAFLSLIGQARGLWGQAGILPMKNYLHAVVEENPTSAYWKAPSLFWLNSSDRAIQGAAVVGAALAFAALVGFAPGWMLFGCFALYLSFVSGGQDFLSFQWDVLLLEVGFLSLFAVPWSWSWQPFHAVEPHAFVRVVFWLVLFKLIFLSGLVKILSGDPAWRDLTALTYHYWTQPLPNPISPFANALPMWFQKISVAVMFAIELGCPFLIWHSRTRMIAVAGIIFLSVLIFITGNFTFFNLLTVALCFWLIPDAVWSRLIIHIPMTMTFQEPPNFLHPFTGAFMLTLCVFSLLWCTRWFLPPKLERQAFSILRWSQPLHISNPYGLFAVMTKTRHEIVIEGSLDGHEWREYEFKYKPGGLYRAPAFIAPFQPRLDWQMWFAALGSYQQSPWLGNLFVRLFQNSADVLKLFAWDPFPDGPPNYLRAELYDYQMATPQEIWRSGQWWHRELIAPYSPVFKNPKAVPLASGHANGLNQTKKHEGP